MTQKHDFQKPHSDDRENCGGDAKRIVEAAAYATGGAGAGAVLATLEVMALTIGGGIAGGVIAGLAIYMLVKVFSELVSLD